MSAGAAVLDRWHRLDADCISDAAGFEALAGEWDALVGAAEMAHPFMLHAWLRTWWQSFGDRASLRVFVVRDGGRLVGAAPLVLSDERLYGIPVRMLRALADDHTPRFEFIAEPARAELVFDALWAAIDARADEWDLLTLRQLPDDSVTLHAIESRANSAGRAVGRWTGELSPFVRFHGAWNRYFDSLSYNHRRNVGKARRRLERLAPLELEVVTGGAGVRDAVDEGMRIEARAWKAHAGTAMVSDPAVCDFYHALAERMAARGLLRLYFLKSGGERIAFSFGLLHADTIFVLKGGYDPRFARYTPYNVLCAMVLHDGFSRGLAGYDFLGDDDRWKRGWTHQARQHHWLYVGSRTLRARAVHFCKFRAAPVIRRLLPQTR